MHVDYLSRELAKLMEGDVRAFGTQHQDAPNLKVRGWPVDSSQFGCPKNLQSIFGALTRCVQFNAAGIDADVVHCHTWYTHRGDLLAKLKYGMPLVITIHPFARAVAALETRTARPRLRFEQAEEIVTCSLGSK